MNEKLYSFPMSRIPTSEPLQLPLVEKLDLIQQLWESVASSQDPYPLSDNERRLIDDRLEAHRRNPDALATWSEVKARLLAKA